MKTIREALSLSLCFLLCLAWTDLALSAASPASEVRSTVDKVLAILKNSGLKSPARAKERREQLRQAIYSRFDFAEMARRSLGSHWRQRTPEEQKEFVRLFTDILERAYVGRIESYNDEKFVYSREKLDRNFAEVNSKVVTQKGDEYSFNYKLHLVNEDWKIYDVVIENISLVNNYRSQFNRILSNSSFEELLRRMREKQIEPAAEK